VPILGFVLNIFLAVYQFNFQPVAWYVTVVWIALGLLVYYAVFEKKGAVLEPQVLIPRLPAAGQDQEPSVLVALHNPDNVEILLDLAYPIARQRRCPLIAVSVVEVPRQMPIHEGLRFAHHKEPLLNKARKIATERGLPLKTDLVVAHLASDGILAAVERHRGEALVMGWKGFTNARDRIFGEVADRIIRLVQCDLMLLKIGESRKIRQCLLPTSGGPNAKLAATVLQGIVQEFKMAVTAGYVVQEGANQQQRDDGERFITETLHHLRKPFKYDKKLIESGSIAGGIARASRDYDLVVIGAAKEPFFRKMLFGEIPEKVARYSPTSVLVVKKYEGVVKSILKKVLG
jgi:nucleotide-binding universal stress UspA family protein